MATILIAEDHAITREPLARLLRGEGYEILTAANGLEALQVLRSHHPDLILLDMMMPKMNGLAFLEAAATWRRTNVDAGVIPGEYPASRLESAGPPVILLTGIADGPEIARARTLGVREVLTKAKFTVEQLLERVRVIIPAEPDSGGPIQPGKAA